MIFSTVNHICECLNKLPCTFVTCCCLSTKKGQEVIDGTGTHRSVSAALICTAQEEIANLCIRKDLQLSEPGKGNAFIERRKKTKFHLK